MAGEAQPAVSPDESVTAWLLEPSNPCVRWRTLSELLGRPDDDPEVREAREAVHQWPAITRIFEMAADPAGFAWPDGIRPGAAQPGRDLAVLARVGVPAGRPELALRAAALKQLLPDNRSSDCYLPQMVTALIRFGDPADPDVPGLVERVVSNEVLADGDRPPTGGGGSCCISHSCHSAVARALDCVVSVPQAARTPLMRDFLTRRGAAAFIPPTGSPRLLGGEGAVASACREVERALGHHWDRHPRGRGTAGRDPNDDRSACGRR